MKTFVWVILVGASTGKEHVTMLDTANRVVCGNILREGELFRPIVMLPKIQATQKLMLLSEAKEAIEKKLFDDGVIEEGDIVEDATEE